MSVAYDEDDQRAGCPSIKEFVAWGSAKLYWSEGHLHAALQVGSQETLSGKNLGGTVYSMLCLKGVVVNVLLIVCTGGEVQVLTEARREHQRFWSWSDRQMDGL